jgi:hydrogenase maturation protein HypF
MSPVAPDAVRLRRAVHVRGTVQGVGFRPAVSRFAAELALGGFVRNDRDGVHIEIEGSAHAVDAFIDGLPRAAPAIALVTSLETTALPARGDREFRIAPSADPASDDAPTLARAGAAIPADLAPCADCLCELGDPGDRRYRYPFINCTACGPRFTIVRALPYDRAHTTMARFPLCAACRHEYDDPGDRRFHAEANACSACGPKLRFVAGDCHLTGEDAIAVAVAALAAGQIIAVKGAGGFLLAVDARDPEAVARLRARKQRPAKPLAVMAGTLAAVEEIATLDDVARRALTSSARPIGLAPARRRHALAAGIAPGLAQLGVFLPSTPLQHLLLHDGPPWLVMTSGNRSEEPIARADGDAFARLRGIADGFLVHDRNIHTRADDSVVSVMCGQVVPVRRARGFVPDAFELPVPAPPDTAILAVGAAHSATVCLARGNSAVLSPHLGDLDDADAFALFEETVERMSMLVGDRPSAVARDRHPDYRSSRWAERWARETGGACERIQHHHAHVASCLVDNSRAGEVLGVVFDGTGLGDDGTLWGGEFLVAGLARSRRVGHLRPLPLLGGEAAIRSPWRLAAAALLESGVPPDSGALAAIPRGQLEAARALWARPRMHALSSGAGRWFDAVAALCGLRTEISYDAQAAIELEAIAAEGDHGRYPLTFEEPDDELIDADGEPAPFMIDLRPMIRAIAHELDGTHAPETPEIAARFHDTLADAIVAGCRRAREAGAPATVALTGGCFQNRRLTERARAGLERAGFEVLLHRRVPCNDGGIALGQVAIAACRRAIAADSANQEMASCA